MDTVILHKCIKNNGDGMFTCDNCHRITHGNSYSQIVDTPLVSFTRILCEDCKKEMEEDDE